MIKQPLYADERWLRVTPLINRATWLSWRPRPFVDHARCDRICRVAAVPLSRVAAIEQVPAMHCRVTTVAHVDDETVVALRELVDLAENFPGQFKPEFDLGYWAGVSDGAERWYVRFEGDIRDGEFTVLGMTASAALRLAALEARARIP